MHIDQQEERCNDNTPARLVTDGIHGRVTTGWHYTSLMPVDHRVKVCEEY